MSIFWALLAVMVTWGGYRLADDYLRRSMLSFGSAEHAWGVVTANAERLMEQDISPAVAKLIVRTVSAAGCGCFVRGMLLGHYLPRSRSTREEADRYWGSLFDEIDSGGQEMGKLFWQFLASVVVYDSFRNPLQGWLFRRALKEMLRPEPSYQAKLEAKSAIFSVVSKRKDKFLPA